MKAQSTHPAPATPSCKAWRAGSARARGLSLFETLLAAAVVVVALGLLVGVSRSLRADTAEQRTLAVLLDLNRALASYQDDHGTPPDTDAPFDALVGQTLVRDGFGHPIAFVDSDFVSPGPDGHLGDPFAEDAKQRRAAADNLYASDLETDLRTTSP